MPKDIPATPSVAPGAELISAFADLARLTAPRCGACRVPHACCSKANCLANLDLARTLYGIELEPGDGPLPFMGEDGCRLAPHLRPLCTVHVCDQHVESDPIFAEHYFEARELAAELLYEQEERSAT